MRPITKRYIEMVETPHQEAIEIIERLQQAYQKTMRVAINLQAEMIEFDSASDQNFNDLKDAMKVYRSIFHDFNLTYCPEERR